MTVQVQSPVVIRLHSGQQYDCVRIVHDSPQLSNSYIKDSVWFLEAVKDITVVEMLRQLSRCKSIPSCDCLVSIFVIQQGGVYSLPRTNDLHSRCTQLPPKKRTVKQKKTIESDEEDTY